MKLVAVMSVTYCTSGFAACIAYAAKSGCSGLVPLWAYKAADACLRLPGYAHLVSQLPARTCCAVLTVPVGGYRSLPGLCCLALPVGGYLCWRERSRQRFAVPAAKEAISSQNAATLGRWRGSVAVASSSSTQHSTPAPSAGSSPLSCRQAAPAGSDSAPCLRASTYSSRDRYLLCMSGV